MQGLVVSLTLDDITLEIAKLHQAGEMGFTQSGRAHGMVALIQPDGSVGAVIPFSPAARPPSDEVITMRARENGAVGLSLTGEYWTNPDPLSRQQVQLDPHDLPVPNSLPPERRGEQIITTAVLRGHDHVLRITTPISRSVFGNSLGERATFHDDAPMQAGEARHLITLLHAAAQR